MAGNLTEQLFHSQEELCSEELAGLLVVLFQHGITSSIGCSLVT
jgi:hypothetical protein